MLREVDAMVLNFKGEMFKGCLSLFIQNPYLRVTELHLPYAVFDRQWHHVLNE